MRNWPVLLLVCGPLCVTASSQTFLGKRDDAWLKNLSSDAASSRRSAAFALGKLAPSTPQVLTALTGALKDSEAGVRDAAAYALGEIALESSANAGRVWEQAGTKLIALLRDGDEKAPVRRSAAYALGACGHSEKQAEAALRRSLEDGAPEVRQGAAGALARSGGKASEAVVRGLIDALNREDDAMAMRDIASALGAIGRPAASSAALPLAKMMRKQRDPVVRKTATAALLSVIGPELAKAPPGTNDDLVRVLQSVLRTGDPELKGLVAGALGSLGEHAAPALPDLAALIDDEKAPAAARRNVVLTLSKMPEAIRGLPEARGEEVVKKLALALDPKQPVEVRLYTAEALTRIQFPLISPAVDALLDAVDKDPDLNVRRRAVWAFLNAPNLGEMPRALKVLRKALGDPDRILRYDAARSLAHGLRAEAGKEVVDVLEKMLHDKDIKIYRAANANVRGGSESAGGQSSVKVQVEGDARFMAAQALGLVGKRAGRESILKTLKEMTASTDPLTKESAVEALKRINAE
jgi:HEAT repeat protein